MENDKHRTQRGPSHPYSFLTASCLTWAVFAFRKVQFWTQWLTVLLQSHITSDRQYPTLHSCCGVWEWATALPRSMLNTQFYGDSSIQLPQIISLLKRPAVICNMLLILERDTHGSLRTDEEPSSKLSHIEVKVQFALVWESSLCSPWNWSPLVGNNLPLWVATELIPNGISSGRNSGPLRGKISLIRQLLYQKKRWCTMMACS